MHGMKVKKIKKTAVQAPLTRGPLSQVKMHYPDTVYMFIHYLKEHKDAGMGGIFNEVQSMLTRGKLDVPLTLCGAVSRGDDLILEQLLKRGLDPNESDSTDHSALHIAASKGNVKAAQLLLDYGADPNSIDQQGSVPLWEAILGKHDAIIKLLLDNGAKLSAGDPSLFACTAAEQNNIELLQEIVRHGADVTLPRSDGNTALHLAVSEGNIEIVKFLVNHGADIDKLNGIGWTPYTLADQQGHEDIKSFFQTKRPCADDIAIKNTSTPSEGRFIGRFRSEPVMRRPADEGSIHSRHRNIWGSGHQRRKVSNFENSLFGIMSAAHGNNVGDRSVPTASPLSRRSFANHDPIRITICCPQKGNNWGKLVLLPGSIKELLEIGAKKFDLLPTKVRSQDRAEISDLDVIRDGDRVLLVTDDWNGELSNA